MALAAIMPALICSNSPSGAEMTFAQTWRAVASTNEAFPVTVSWSVVSCRNRPVSAAIFLAASSLIEAEPAVSRPTSRLLICSPETCIFSHADPVQRHSATMFSVVGS